MDTHPTIALIERRISANRFDSSHRLTEAEVEKLVCLATRAPTAYHLQNWRFIAARTHESKAKLRALAYDQAKVSDAAVTFIVCGLLPDPETIPERLISFVDAGYMRADISSDWLAGARTKYANAQSARDEAVRSATLGAATLIYAAEAMDFVSGPMNGFDEQGVVREFGLTLDEVPVMLVAVGRKAPGNWPQKPRRPLSEVLQIL
jgi:nitroreductase